MSAPSQRRTFPMLRLTVLITMCFAQKMSYTGINFMREELKQAMSGGGSEKGMRSPKDILTKQALHRRKQDSRTVKTVRFGQRSIGAVSPT